MLTETKNAEMPGILEAIPEHQSALVKTLISEKNTKIISLENQLEKAQAQITWFKEQFKIQQQRLFGRSTEASATLQMDLIFNEADVLSESEDAVDSEESITEDISYTRKKAKTCGRKLDTDNYPVNVIVMIYPMLKKSATVVIPLKKSVKISLSKSNIFPNN